MLKKISTVLQLLIYSKINRIDSLKDKLKTQFFYKFFFKSIGKNSVIKSPMFMENVQNITLKENVFIRNGVRLEVVDSINGSIILGHNVSLEQNCHIISSLELFVEDNTTISANVFITNIDHEYKNIDMHILKQPCISKKTYIGKNCFIGFGVVIQAGTVLGKQCIVGAHSVVRGEFPDYCVIVGAPAKIIKRYDVETQKWRRTNKHGEFIDEV